MSARADHHALGPSGPDLGGAPRPRPVAARRRTRRAATAGGSGRWCVRATSIRAPPRSGVTVRAGRRSRWRRTPPSRAGRSSRFGRRRRYPWARRAPRRARRLRRAVRRPRPRPRVAPVGEAAEHRDQGGPDLVLVGVVDEGPVQRHEVGREGRQPPEAEGAAAGVVDRHLGPGLAPRLEESGDRGAVIDRVVLGELEDDPPERPVTVAHGGGRGIVQVEWGGVDGDEGVVGKVVALIERVRTIPSSRALSPRRSALGRGGRRGARRRWSPLLWAADDRTNDGCGPLRSG